MLGIWTAGHENNEIERLSTIYCNNISRSGCNIQSIAKFYIISKEMINEFRQNGSLFAMKFPIINKNDINIDAFPLYSTWLDLIELSYSNERTILRYNPPIDYNLKSNSEGNSQIKRV